MNGCDTTPAGESLPKGKRHGGRKEKHPEKVNLPAGPGGFGIRNGVPFFVQDEADVDGQRTRKGRGRRHGGYPRGDREEAKKAIDVAEVMLTLDGDQPTKE